MNWDRIQEGWKQLKRRFTRRGARQVREKQVADWVARQHKADPIHK
jgi:hypothetical protein